MIIIYFLRVCSITPNSPILAMPKGPGYSFLSFRRLARYNSKFFYIFLVILHSFNLMKTLSLLKGYPLLSLSQIQLEGVLSMRRHFIIRMKAF